ncbi:hypothetical protein BKA62DRAFT_675782 [Auriculariales sp. MPI-PUGE-AT-0066]|nr:hypothetical protein BKA62DRAFT_675782 [Auriculariales sp. MPI-PUGE-AT-0066]
MIEHVVNGGIMRQRHRTDDPAVNGCTRQVVDGCMQTARKAAEAMRRIVGHERQFFAPLTQTSAAFPRLTVSHLESVVARFDSKACDMCLHGCDQSFKPATIRKFSRPRQRQSTKTFYVEGLYHGDGEPDDMPVNTRDAVVYSPPSNNYQRRRTHAVMAQSSRGDAIEPTAASRSRSVRPSITVMFLKLAQAFEHLVSVRVFQSAGPATGIARQFWKYRCAPDHHDIKIAIAETGQMNLKKWLEKSTQAQ